MKETTNYLGHTTLTHATGEEVTVMLEEVTSERSSEPVFFVSLHTEDKEARTYTMSNKWFDTLEEATAEFHERVEGLEDCGYVASTYID